jgi:hypothetical protein
MDPVAGDPLRIDGFEVQTNQGEWTARVIAISESPAQIRYTSRSTRRKAINPGY